MNNAYTQAISSARGVDSSIRNRLRGWLVLNGENAEATLVALSYIKEGLVDASVVWVGTDPKGAITMLADHLNEKAGAGPELVSALSNVYRQGAKGLSLLAGALNIPPSTRH